MLFWSPLTNINNTSCEPEEKQLSLSIFLPQFTTLKENDLPDHFHCIVFFEHENTCCTEIDYGLLILSLNHANFLVESPHIQPISCGCILLFKF